MVAKVAIDRARLPVLRKKRGVWVYRSGKPAEASIPDLLEEQRRQRTRQVYKEGGLKAAPGLSPAGKVSGVLPRTAPLDPAGSCSS